VVRRVGALVNTGDPWEPYRLLNSSGELVAAVAAYFGELQAAGRSTATQRSYGMAPSALDRCALYVHLGY
jgi:hypothetical protein